MQRSENQTKPKIPQTLDEAESFAVLALGTQFIAKNDLMLILINVKKENFR